MRPELITVSVVISVDLFGLTKVLSELHMFTSRCRL